MEIPYGNLDVLYKLQRAKCDWVLSFGLCDAGGTGMQGSLMWRTLLR